MIYKVTRPEIIRATVALPASKSLSNRLLIIHALSGGNGLSWNLSESDDTRVMLKALSGTEPVKDVGAAGTSMRFLTAYYSCREGRVRMTGSDRMKERPIGPLVDALLQLGASIEYVEKAGFPPLDITGRKLPGGVISIDGSISSQFISALLMIAPLMENGLKLCLRGEIVSSSYILMTLQLMSECGAKYTWEGNCISVYPGTYTAGELQVESDWSAASYWYLMILAEENARIELSYLNERSLQGDRALAEIFQRLGVSSEFGNGILKLKNRNEKFKGQFDYDFTNSPDLVQSMAVGLCMAEIPFRFTGTMTLKIKETDRINALRSELGKLGYMLESDAAGTFLEWSGKRMEEVSSPVIETYDDHRMAMAFAPVALSRGEIRIKDPMVVSKSYPRFWSDLKSAGFLVEEQ